MYSMAIIAPFLLKHAISASKQGTIQPQQSNPANPTPALNFGPAMLEFRETKPICFPPRSPMLSLIAIAKNEAAGMADFLRHHQDLFDELIVIDTGSTDQTATIATDNGAKVFDFTWCDDFSAARNFSLEKASQKWALCLDIDEFIAQSDFERLRQLIQKLQDQPTCFMLPQWNYYDDARHQEWQPVRGQYPEFEKNHEGFFVAQQYRLFPTDCGLNWQGRVHEDMSPSLKTAKVPSKFLDIPIHHYGYVKSDEHNRDRNDMYGRLVRKKVEDAPDNWSANLELAYILVQEGQGRQAIPVLEKLNKIGKAGPVLSRAQAMLAKLYVADDRPDEAIAVLHQTVTQNPNWLFGWTDLIKLLIDGQHWEQAESAISVTSESFVDEPLLMKLECQLMIKTRRIVEAIPLARRISQLVPGMQEYARIADQCEALARKEGLL